MQTKRTWLVHLFLLLTVAAPAFAQQDTFYIRLFSQRKLDQLRIEPIVNTLLRTCAMCSATPLREPRIFPAHSVGYLSGTYRIVVPNAAKISFTGESHILSDRNGIHINVTLSRDDYVAAVLAGEVPTDSAPEFLKAMAVAVRTYAFHESSRHRAEGFDFCDSTHCQDLKLDRLEPRFHSAAESTKNELLWFQGQPALTYYHQDCGGRTAEERESWPVANSPGYLPSHEDPYCLRANGIHWQSELRKTDLLSALRGFPSLHLPNATITVADRTTSGRVHLLRFDQALLSATTFRFSVGRTLGWNLVRSDLYDIRDLGDRILLTGRGSGHGVGLCQNGAAQMAHEGKSYREILAFYYPGTRLGVSAQEIPWQRLTAENLILWTTDPSRDGAMLQRTSQLRANIEDDTGLHTGDTLQLRVYPDMAAYRNATGEPGWIAAYTQRDTIHLQPLISLRDRGLLDSTLRHELLHHAVDVNTHARLPRWFQEGIVEYLADPADSTATPSRGVANLDAELVQRNDCSRVAADYRESANQVAFLVARYGKPTVLGWLHSGIPANVLRH